MSSQLRKGIFYGLVFVFMVLGTWAVLYTQGWRIDFGALKIRKVGAIYVQSFPPKAKIYLNDVEIKNNSWFFQNGTFINNLFPKNYKLTLVYNRYKTWEETIPVLPTQVSEVKYAVLVPEDSLYETGSEGPFLVMNHNLIRKEKGSLVYRGSILKGTSILGWTNDGTRVLSSDAKSTYYWSNLVNGTTTPLNPILKKLGISSPELLVNPEDTQKIIVLTPTQLFFLDPTQGTLTSLDSPKLLKKQEELIVNPAAIAPSRFLLGWGHFNQSENSSSLVLYDIFLRNRLNTPPSFPGKIIKLEWTTNNRLGVLLDNGNLFLYTVSGNKLAPIASDVRDFEFSPDGDRVATLGRKSLEIISLSGNDDDYRRLNIPNINSVQKIIWYRDLEHLLVVYPNSVRFLDLNDRALENFPTVINSGMADYDKDSNKLYYLDGEKIMSVEFPR